jgi:hypothetical protein
VEHSKLICKQFWKKLRNLVTLYLFLSVHFFLCAISSVAYAEGGSGLYSPQMIGHSDIIMLVAAN